MEKKPEKEQQNQPLTLEDLDQTTGGEHMGIYCTCESPKLVPGTNFCLRCKKVARGGTSRRTIYG